MALFPTCLATWSPGTPRAPAGCHPQTMPTCSAVSGPWLRRVSACPEGGWEQAGRGRGRGRESDGRPAPTVHSSLSSVLAALTTERDRLRDLHQGSEPSRLGVRLGAGWPVGGAGPSPRTAGLGVVADLGREGRLEEAGCAWQAGEGFTRPVPAPVPSPSPCRSLRPQPARGASTRCPCPPTPLQTPSAPSTPRRWEPGWAAGTIPLGLLSQQK